MAKAKKITKAELESITGKQSQVKDVLIGIGALEAQKSSAVLQP